MSNTQKQERDQAMSEEQIVDVFKELRLPTTPSLKAPVVQQTIPIVYFRVEIFCAQLEKTMWSSTTSFAGSIRCSRLGRMAGRFEGAMAKAIIGGIEIDTDGDVDLRGTAITALPDNLTVRGSLHLSGWWFDIATGGMFAYQRESRTFTVIDRDAAEQLIERLAPEGN